MFDDLRGAQVEPEKYPEDTQPSLVERLPLFSQLKPWQRLFLAALLFLNVTLLGFGCLLASYRIILP